MSEIIDVTPTLADSSKNPQSAITLTHVLYGLHALAPFTMLTLAVLAMIIGMIKRNDVRDTWLETHFSWLSRTFWWGVLWWILAWAMFWLLTVITLGFGVVVAWIFPAGVFIWYLYRVLVGWLKLGDLKPIS